MQFPEEHARRAPSIPERKEELGGRLAAGWLHFPGTGGRRSAVKPWRRRFLPGPLAGSVWRGLRTGSRSGRQPASGPSGEALLGFCGSRGVPRNTPASETPGSRFQPASLRLRFLAGAGGDRPVTGGASPQITHPSLGAAEKM